MNLASILGFVAALCTMMLGSIPQQDVFQRITSSKNVNIAVNAAILGGVLYFILCLYRCKWPIQPRSSIQDW